MKRLAVIAVLVALPGCFSACPTSEDARAKERIFSPEEPPQAEQAASEHIDLASFASEPAIRRRVLRMAAPEMRYRLGSFAAETRVDFAWTRGDKKVALSETAELEQAPDGAFRMEVDNDHDFGLELRWVDGKVFVRNRHGHFFERRSDRAAHESWRDEAVAQLPALLDLVKGRAHVVETGTASHHGRPAVKYAVTLADASDPALTAPPRPSWARDPVYPKDGPDASLRHRLAVFETGKAVELTGQILVDRDTGVPVSFDLRTRLKVPPVDGQGDDPAVLRLHMTRDVTEVGAARTIEVPEHRPFKSRPRAVESPLAWWPKYVPPEKAKADGASDAPSKDGEE